MKFAQLILASYRVFRPEISREAAMFDSPGLSCTLTADQHHFETPRYDTLLSVEIHEERSHSRNVSIVAQHSSWGLHPRIPITPEPCKPLQKREKVIEFSRYSNTWETASIPGTKADGREEVYLWVERSGLAFPKNREQQRLFAGRPLRECFS